MAPSRRSFRASTGPPSSRRRSQIPGPPSSSGRPPSPAAGSTRATPPAISMPMVSMAASANRRRVTARRWILGLAGAGLALAAATAPASANGADWPKYLHDNGGSGYAADGGLTPAGAATLDALPGWPVKLGGTISTQPLLANNLIYVGAWDGYEYALRPSGAIQWKRFLGITTRGKACQYPIGLAGTAAVAGATGNGAPCSVFGSQLGSLVRPKRAAATGALALLGLMLAGFAWPRPSIRGLFWTGLGVAVAGVAATSLLLVGPQVQRGEPYAQAIVKLSAADLHPQGQWQVPAAEATGDSDFGC